MKSSILVRRSVTSFGMEKSITFSPRAHATVALYVGEETSAGSVVPNRDADAIRVERATNSRSFSRSELTWFWERLTTARLAAASGQFASEKRASRTEDADRNLQSSHGRAVRCLWRR